MSYYTHFTCKTFVLPSYTLPKFWLVSKLSAHLTVLMFIEASCKEVESSLRSLVKQSSVYIWKHEEHTPAQPELSELRLNFMMSPGVRSGDSPKIII